MPGLWPTSIGIMPGLKAGGRGAVRDWTSTVTCEALGDHARISDEVSVRGNETPRFPGCARLTSARGGRASNYRTACFTSFGLTSLLG